MPCESIDKAARILYTCSGCCFEGEIADRVGRRLRKDGFARCGGSCLAGIGAGYPRFLEAAKKATDIITIDGCRMVCAKRVLEKAALHPTQSYVLSQMGLTETNNPEDFINYACAEIFTRQYSKQTDDEQVNSYL